MFYTLEWGGGRGWRENKRSQKAQISITIKKKVKVISKLLKSI